MINKKKSKKSSTNIMRDIYRSYLKNTLLSKKYTIAEINLLNEKIRKEPEIYQKIKTAIKEKRFRLDLFIDSLKKEKEMKIRLRDEKRNESVEKITEAEKQTYIRFLYKKGVRKHSKTIVELLSKNYNSKEIRDILLKIIKIKNKMDPDIKQTFYTKIVLEIEQKKPKIKEILDRLIIVDNNKLTELTINLLPNLNKK